MVKEQITNAVKQLFIKNNITDFQLQLVGSVAIGIDINTSDLDFMLTVPEEKQVFVLNILKQIMEFRGERPATEATTRHLFCLKIENKHIDINLMKPNDFMLFGKGIQNAHDLLSDEEKQQIIKEKQRLKQLGKSTEYEDYKLGIYKKFCPEFIFYTDYELIKSLAQKCIKENRVLPDWLQAKVKQFDIVL